MRPRPGRTVEPLSAVEPDIRVPITKVGLLLIGAVSLGLCSGCASTSGSWRALTSRPHSSIKARTLSQPAATAARPSKSKVAPIDDDAETAEVQQVSDQQPVAEESATAASGSSGSSAGPATPTPDPQQITQLSLAELERLALQYNPTLCQAQAAISAETGIYRQAGLYPNPQLGYLNGSASKPNVKQSNGVFFSQEIVTARKLDCAKQSAAIEIRRYQWDYEAQQQRILNDLKIRYYEVLGAQESLAVMDRLVKIAERSLQIAEKRMEGIHGTKTDLLQARVQLESVLLLKDEAENRYQGAWERMTTMMGVSWLKPVPLSEKLSDNIPLLDLDSSAQHLSDSPQLHSTECDLSHSWATYREACAQAVPNVTFQAVGEYDQAFQASVLTTLVAMPIPIINRNQGNIDKASADIVAAQAEITRVQLLQREQLSDTFQAYKDNLRKADRLKNVILKSAEENLKLTQDVYESGEIGFAQVLTAQQSYFQSQLDYVTALTEVHKTAVSIEGYLLSGGLNPAAIGSAIQNQPGGGTQRQRALLGEIQDKSSKQLLPAAQISQ